MIDEVVARVTHEADTVEQPASDKLSCDDHGIDGQSQAEARTQMFKGGKTMHTYSVARASNHGKRWRNVLNLWLRWADRQDNIGFVTEI